MDDDRLVERARVSDDASRECPDGAQRGCQHFLVMLLSEILFGHDGIIGCGMGVGEERLEPPSYFDECVGKGEVFDVFTDV